MNSSKQKKQERKNEELIQKLEEIDRIRFKESAERDLRKYYKDQNNISNS